MATLLHIDSSVFPGGASASRAVTEPFRKTWPEQHPESTVIYRDLSVAPRPAHHCRHTDRGPCRPERPAPPTT